MGQHLARSKCYSLLIPLFLWSLLPLCFCSYYQFHLSKAFTAHFALVISVLAHIMSSAMFFVFFAVPVPSTVLFQPQRPASVPQTPQACSQLSTFVLAVFCLECTSPQWCMAAPVFIPVCSPHQSDFPRLCYLHGILFTLHIFNCWVLFLKVYHYRSILLIFLLSSTGR